MESEFSESPIGAMACPICGLANSKTAFSMHLESHSKQSLIDMLLQQQEVLQTIKPGTSRSSHGSGRRSPAKKHSTTSKSTSGRRHNNSGGHSEPIVQELNSVIVNDANYQQELLHDQSEQVHPIENIETIEQVQGQNGAIILYQLELQNIDDVRHENNGAIPFTTIQQDQADQQDPLRNDLENGPQSCGPVRPKNSNTISFANPPLTGKQEPGSRDWAFSSTDLTEDYSSFAHVPLDSRSISRIITCGDSTVAIVDGTFSNDRSNSNNTQSQGDVDLMTDEEIPPRGEISEYEESSSNTSSFHSAHDDSNVQRGSFGPSLGSLFSDVRRLSPIVVDSESLSSQSKKRKKKPRSQTSPLVSAIKANPDGLICLDCTEAKYFGSIFELAQHQSEAHPETYKSFSKQNEQNSHNANTLSSLPWTSKDRKLVPLAKTESPSGVGMERKKIRKNYGKQYACLYCNFSGAQKQSLAEHMTSEHPTVKPNSTLFECRNCGKICKSRSSLVKHLLIHNGKKHTCSYCTKRFTSNFKLREHERVHTGIYPFKCADCDKMFRTPSLRTAHLKKVHLGEVIVKPKPEYYCKICCRILRSKKSLNNHMDIHLDQSVQKCPHCPETFQKHRVLVRHIRSNHDSTYAAKESRDCPICSKKLHPNSMRSHMRIHNNEKPYSCTMCSLTFRTYSNLTSHSWSHTNVDKPFKCVHCSKSYLFKKVLEAHMMVHKRRTFHFVCNECGVKFTSKANMKRHVQEHYNAKKFKCKVCSKTFHRNYYLVEHERIHTGTKLFSCSICGKNSSTKSNHRAHVKIHDARESGSLEG